MTQNEGNVGSPPDFLPVRMLNEFVYCQRLFYIEMVNGEFRDSADTIEGRIKHKRVDKETGKLQPVSETGEEAIHATSVQLSSERYRIISKIDLVEGSGSTVTPVEYKRGSKPDNEEGSWPADRAQLCAQALILRENGYSCAEGVLYYAASKERVTIPITEDLVSQTLHELEECLRVAGSGSIPPPLIDSQKCPRCSLVGICLPDETTYLQTIEIEREEKRENIRRLVPLRDDKLPVYVEEQGGIVGKKGEEIEIRVRDKPPVRVRLMEISQVALFGNAQISTQTVHELCARDIPILYFSLGGWFYGLTHGISNKNVELRRRQYQVAGNTVESNMISRRFVEGKIRNCRTMLRRNCRESPDASLKQLMKLAQESSKMSNNSKLLGIEGEAARVYFMNFSRMLKPESSLAGFDFSSRNRRPPKDPVNAMLSFVYALLAKEVTVSLMAVGFDPYMGFYHQPKYGKPALSLDMMEQFRPLIGDSVVITMINNGEIDTDDFIRRGDSVALTSKGRKRVIEAYERRMDSTVTHPVFGYTISYRRVMEVEARMLSRYLSGEIKELPLFCTR